MRRSRFIVTLNTQDGVQQREVLGYSAENVRTWAERHFGWFGFEVTSVKPKPRAARGTAPGGAFTPSWAFDLRAIQEAFEAMTGASLPAGLKFEYGRRGARRRGVFEWRYHSLGRGVTLYDLTVRVRRDLSPARANRTLWHELAHVAQYVRCPDDAAYVRAHVAERRARYGYLNRPCEREAREWECLAETDWLLDGERRGEVDNAADIG